MRDRRYQVPVNNVQPEQLKVILNRAMVSVAKEFPPKTGIIVFAFDFGGEGGMSYVSNAERNDCIKALEEWIAHAKRIS